MVQDFRLSSLFPLTWPESPPGVKREGLAFPLRKKAKNLLEVGMSLVVWLDKTRKITPAQEIALEVFLDSYDTSESFSDILNSIKNEDGEARVKRGFRKAGWRTIVFEIKILVEAIEAYSERGKA